MPAACQSMELFSLAKISPTGFEWKINETNVMPTPRKSPAKKAAKSVKKKTAIPFMSANNNSSISVAEFPRRTVSVVAPKSPGKPFAAPTSVSISKLTPSASRSSVPVTKFAAKTEVIAQVDVGFGNTLSIRGLGAGLSWEKGLPMEWSEGAWTWTTSNKENFEFKVLINDSSWAQGENLHAKAGTKVVFKPTF